VITVIETLDGWREDIPFMATITLSMAWITWSTLRGEK